MHAYPAIEIDIKDEKSASETSKEPKYQVNVTGMVFNVFGLIIGAYAAIGSIRHVDWSKIEKNSMNIRLKDSSQYLECFN